MLRIHTHWIHTLLYVVVHLLIRLFLFLFIHHFSMPFIFGLCILLHVCRCIITGNQDPPSSPPPTPHPPSLWPLPIYTFLLTKRKASKGHEKSPTTWNHQISPTFPANFATCSSAFFPSPFLPTTPPPFEVWGLFFPTSLSTSSIGGVGEFRDGDVGEGGAVGEEGRDGGAGRNIIVGSVHHVDI